VLGKGEYPPLASRPPPAREKDTAIADGAKERSFVCNRSARFALN